MGSCEGECGTSSYYNRSTVRRGSDDNQMNVTSLHHLDIHPYAQVRECSFFSSEVLGGRQPYLVCRPSSRGTCPDALSSPPIGALFLIAFAFLSGSCGTTSYATTLRLCRLPHLPGHGSVMHATYTKCFAFMHGPQLDFPCRISRCCSRRY